jgi:cell division protease FtsH
MQSENKPPKGGTPEGQKKGPKINLYVIYGIIAVLLLVASLGRFSPDLITITEQEFMNEMLLKGDVEKIDLVKNKDRVRVYIRPDSLKKEFYVTKLKKTVIREKAKEPLFEFQVLDWKSYREYMKEAVATKNIPEVKERIIEDQDWTSPLFNTIFSLLLIVGVWVLMRRKRPRWYFQHWKI